MMRRLPTANSTNNDSHAMTGAPPALSRQRQGGRPAGDMQHEARHIHHRYQPVPQGDLKILRRQAAQHAVQRLARDAGQDFGIVTGYARHRRGRLSETVMPVTVVEHPPLPLC